MRLYGNREIEGDYPSVEVQGVIINPGRREICPSNGVDFYYFKVKTVSGLRFTAPVYGRVLQFLALYHQASQVEDLVKITDNLNEVVWTFVAEKRTDGDAVVYMLRDIFLFEEKPYTPPISAHQGAYSLSSFKPRTTVLGK